MEILNLQIETEKPKQKKRIYGKSNNKANPRDWIFSEFFFDFISFYAIGLFFFFFAISLYYCIVTWRHWNEDWRRKTKEWRLWSKIQIYIPFKVRFLRKSCHCIFSNVLFHLNSLMDFPSWYKPHKQTPWNMEDNTAKWNEAVASPWKHNNKYWIRNKARRARAETSMNILGEFNSRALFFFSD